MGTHSVSSRCCWVADGKGVLGLFTYFVLKGLQGAADLNRDGAITIGEMEQYIQDENIAVPYFSRREFQRLQTPQVIGKD